MEGKLTREETETGEERLDPEIWALVFSYCDLVALFYVRMVCRAWAVLVPSGKLDDLKRGWWDQFWWLRPGDMSYEIPRDCDFYFQKRGTAYAIGTRRRPYWHHSPFGPNGSDSVRACKLSARSGLVFVYMCINWWYARGPEYAVVCSTGTDSDDGRCTIYFVAYHASASGGEYCGHFAAEYLAPALEYPIGTGGDGRPFTVKLPAEMIPGGNHLDSILAGLLQMCHNALREVVQVVEAQERRTVRDRDRRKKRKKKKTGVKENEEAGDPAEALHCGAGEEKAEEDHGAGDGGSDYGDEVSASTSSASMAFPDRNGKKRCGRKRRRVGKSGVERRTSTERV